MIARDTADHAEGRVRGRAAVARIGLRLRPALAAARGSVALSIVTALALTGLFLWQVHALLAAEAWLEHTDQAMKQAITLQKIILDAETGMRGFLLSGQARALRPYQDAGESFAAERASLRALVSDNPNQVRRLDEITARFTEWTAVAQRTIRGDLPRPLARDYFSIGDGVATIDLIRARINALLDEEQDRRIQRSRTVQTRVVHLFVSGAALSFALRLALLWIKRRLLS